MSTLVDSNICQHCLIQTDVNVGWFKQMSTLVDSTRCQHWLIQSDVNVGWFNQNVNIGWFNQMSTLVDSNRCQHWLIQQMSTLVDSTVVNIDWFNICQHWLIQTYVNIGGFKLMSTLIDSTVVNIDWFKQLSTLIDSNRCQHWLIQTDVNIDWFNSCQHWLIQHMSTLVDSTYVNSGWSKRMSTLVYDKCECQHWCMILHNVNNGRRASWCSHWCNISKAAPTAESCQRSQLLSCLLFDDWSDSNLETRTHPILVLIILKLMLLDGRYAEKDIFRKGSQK